MLASCEHYSLNCFIWQAPMRRFYVYVGVRCEESGVIGNGQHTSTPKSDDSPTSIGGQVSCTSLNWSHFDNWKDKSVIVLAIGPTFDTLLPRMLVPDLLGSREGVEMTSEPWKSSQLPTDVG